MIKSLALKAGTERVMSDKMNWLASRGCEIILVTYEQGLHPFAFQLDDSIKHYDLGTRFFELGHFTPIKKIFLYFYKKRQFENKLRTIVNKEKPDIFVATTYSGLLLGKVKNLKLTIPKLLESHAICETHWKSKKYNSGLKVFIGKLYDRFFLNCIRSFDVLVTLTFADAKEWSQYVSNIKVVPNPISYVPSSIGNIVNSHRIICVGRLEKEKGFDLLVEAFSMIADKCPDWYIDIYGEGGEEAFLSNIISVKGLDRRIIINKPTDHIFEEYINSGMFVLSSRNEGFGLVLLEAMACGLPCISFNCPSGPGEIIEDGKNGLLVKNGDIEDLADKMLWMIENPEQRVDMGKMAKQSVGHFDKNTIMQEWVSIFDSLL